MVTIDTDILLQYGASYKQAVTGEIIFQEGMHPLFYYQVVTGCIRWSNFTEDGKEVLQLLLGQGETFGEIALFDAKPYAATAIADADTLLLKLPITAFFQLLKDNFDIHCYFDRILAQRLRFKCFLLKETSNVSPEVRLRKILAYFKLTLQNVCPNCLKVKLTRQQLANLTGLRVETVIRGIKCLEKKGIVRIEKGKVFLQDTPLMEDTYLTSY